jgi:putative protein-disulfide isomerase
MNELNNNLKAGSIDITYFTDPLCCWSWAFESEWEKLLAIYKPHKWRYCMGGLLPDWNNYHDTVNSISKPLQMGPMWMHAMELTGVEIHHDIWVKDPPASSYPACIAVKAAAQQSENAGERYLHLIREACMLHGKNIAKRSVLIDTAKLVAVNKNFAFDVQRFEQDLNSSETLEAFRKDLQEVKYYGINRFPTLVIKNDSNKAKLIRGYHRFETIAEILNGVW